MSDTLRLACQWLGLILLTVASVHAADLLVRQGAQLVMIGLALAKAWLIIDGFMELRHGPPAWRWLLMGWPVIMVLALLCAGFLRPA